MADGLKRIAVSSPPSIQGIVTLPNKKLMMYRAFVSVGSNLGDKIENCRKGIEALLADGSSVLVKSSSYYRTSPVDYKDQDWFVNLVVKIKTSLDPYALLNKMHGIEKAIGRKANTVRFGPRVLDLDIVLFDDRVIQTEKLEVPHPRMHKRRFVLKPICDIEPSMVHPVLGKDMLSLLEGLQDTEQKIVEI